MTLTTYPPELAAILARLDDPARPQEAAADQAARLIAADWLDERAGDGIECPNLQSRRVAGFNHCGRPCPLCRGESRVPSGYSDYAAFLRLMAREGVCPTFLEGDHESYRRTPWVWGPAGPAPKYLRSEIWLMVFDCLPLPPAGGWGEGYRNEGRTSLWSYQTRDRAERALYAAWVAADRPATLRG